MEMGDLHSIAYSGCCTTSNSFAWEFHNLGVFNADMSNLVMSSSTPPYDLSSLDSDYSTGYLQDALFEFSSKRRRLLLFSEDKPKYSTCPTESCWKQNFTDIYPGENFGYLNQINEIDFILAGKSMNNNRSASDSSSEGEIIVTEEDAKTSEEGGRTDFEGPVDSSSSSQSKDSLHHNIPSISETLDAISPSPAGTGEKKKKEVLTRVVYPFAVVKPGGIEGDVTLNDINERLLMPPTRPVRHPVGDFACRPLVFPLGPGLSGKAVVALTRIQTHGRGTITIIRTRG